MGAGGRMRGKEEEAQLRRVPHEKPPFTIGQLKKAIPPHCFQPSALRSFSYVALDLTVASFFFYIAVALIPDLSEPLRIFSWLIYWAAQGCVLTGVWVIAHECGHHAFAHSSLLNDAVGLVLHSAILNPYFSWKYSHRRHHSNAASLDRDEVIVPKRRSALPSYAPLLNNPVGRCVYITFGLTFAWPLYIAFNFYGRKYPRFASHFDPYSPIFSDRERAHILISDIGVISAAFVFLKLATTMGFWFMVRVYGVPLLVMNGLLVFITYLHHTHPALPHYDSSEWDWLRGALSTVDRDYGMLNHVFHHFTDTHVAHHLFSTIPHYHAKEATRVIRPLLGDYYRMDRTPLFIAAWRDVKECLYVEPDQGKGKNNGVFWFRNKL